MGFPHQLHPLFEGDNLAWVCSLEWVFGGTTLGKLGHWREGERAAKKYRVGNLVKISAIFLWHLTACGRGRGRGGTGTATVLPAAAVSNIGMSSSVCPLPFLLQILASTLEQGRFMKRGGGGRQDTSTYSSEIMTVTHLYCCSVPWYSGGDSDTHYYDRWVDRLSIVILH